uniref:Protocadherin 2 alpha a 15 n=1 Tax=Cyprinodon variegatus TaxID=28743 RepID=A0A3Q2E1A5_CYPVA
MEQRQPERRRARKIWTLILMLSMQIWIGVTAQFRYSVFEEVSDGTVVGNIAKDLGLDKTMLKERGIRIVYGSTEPPFMVKQDDGVLYVRSKIDREEICDRKKVCVIDIKTVLQNPLEIHHVAVEILDVNDHSPIFPQKGITLEVSESALPGAKFQLQAARDADSGLLSVQQYRLSQNSHFRLDVKDRGEDRKTPSLVLEKPLDRESVKSHVLLLTALDGGKPPRLGNMTIIVNVSDVNDNPPVFSEELYIVSLKENSPVGTTVIQVNATDLDEGSNGELEYTFGNDVDAGIREHFHLNPLTGVIVVAGPIDFEECSRYEIDVQASDKSPATLNTEKSVVINIVDINDNEPEIEVTSFSNALPEDSKPGTTVALISVKDADSGLNGQVICYINQDLPFQLTPSSQSNMYSLVTKTILDREHKSQYNIKIVAKDSGQPSLQSEKNIRVDISDVNDNLPEFSQRPYIFYVYENNTPGGKIASVKATDKDVDMNAIISYQISRERELTNMLASFVNINSETGDIVALKSFDFETLKMFHFQVIATDSGTPPLSSNVTVNVFILDQNDNPPVILHPISSNGSAEGVEEIPLRAYDADIGYNGWLLFSLQEVTDHSLFGLDRYTGQIRTLRSFTERDEAEHKLVILVKDNGNVSLSATATVIIKLVEPKEAFAASDVKSATQDDEDNNVTFYLMITLGAVSVLFIISIVVLIAMQCSKSTDYASKCLQETNYDGTLCHSIQYRSGDRRYMLVGPRMSIGSTVVPGSHANTLVLPERKKTYMEVRIIIIFYHSWLTFFWLVCLKYETNKTNKKKGKKKAHTSELLFFSIDFSSFLEFHRGSKGEGLLDIQRIMIYISSLTAGTILRCNSLYFIIIPCLLTGDLKKSCFSCQMQI